MGDSADRIEQAKKLLREELVELNELLAKDQSRSRGMAVSRRHAVLQMLAENKLFYSQHGQDRIIDTVLNGKKNGIFVDIGGYDGITGSNSLFFEQFRNWTGVLIEPSEKQITTARELRRCPCLNYAVDKENGKADFMEVTAGYTQMSGFLHSYVPHTLEKVRANPDHAEVIHQVEMRTPASILEDQKIDHVDYISLDVEGCEMNILEDFPFDRFDVSTWSIEDNEQTKTIINFMRSKNYKLIEFSGHDYIFKKEP